MRFILQDDVYDQLPANWDNLVAKANAYVERKVMEGARQLGPLVGYQRR